MNGIGALRKSCWVYVLAAGDRPVLDGARKGIREVFSARQADALLVCGVPSEEGRKHLAAAFNGMPVPRLAFLLDAAGAAEAIKEIDAQAVVIELRSSADDGAALIAEMSEALAKPGSSAGAASPSGSEGEAKGDPGADEKAES